ncbi:hypothetical protein JDV02_001951 [Purpureocillium takamizusanense]|uniref:Uncharacterized protein n=1 Tax=Purpureocillium takamizusanense TaxID=2060973 RepID=A0A9Q8Q9Z9_9HYPO|nr:uncharacterized protein JDV02_001951 [Purpureocillium takamizusanense]UNI15416.1 hypothetical protein JDV02_001951 [Purpureocillium takamizusanense]
MKFATCIVVALGSSVLALPDPASRSAIQRRAKGECRRPGASTAAAPGQTPGPVAASNIGEDQLLSWVSRPGPADIEKNKCNDNPRERLLTVKNFEKILAKAKKCGTGIACRTVDDPAVCFAKFKAPPNHPKTKLPWKEPDESDYEYDALCEGLPWKTFYPEVPCGTKQHCVSYDWTNPNDDKFRNEADCLGSHEKKE